MIFTNNLNTSMIQQDDASGATVPTRKYKKGGGKSVKRKRGAHARKIREARIARSHKFEYNKFATRLSYPIKTDSSGTFVFFKGEWYQENAERRPKASNNINRDGVVKVLENIVEEVKDTLIYCKSLVSNKSTLKQIESMIKESEVSISLNYENDKREYLEKAKSLIKLILPYMKNAKELAKANKILLYNPEDIDRRHVSAYSYIGVSFSEKLGWMAKRKYKGKDYGKNGLKSEVEAALESDVIQLRVNPGCKPNLFNFVHKDMQEAPVQMTKLEKRAALSALLCPMEIYDVTKKTLPYISKDDIELITAFYGISEMALRSAKGSSNPILE